jgi:hypothetical protein
MGTMGEPRQRQEQRMTNTGDLVDRLRSASRSYDRFTYGSVLIDAATELERLSSRVADLEAACRRQGEFTR